MNLPDEMEAWIRALTLLPLLACSIVGLALTLAKGVQLHRSCRAGDRLFL